MEVQQLPQQSVQINLNNKIITLHNVTIVKNPRIVKVDAAQYSNLLKGAVSGNGQQIKFVNSGAVNVKLPMPSLVPMKSAPSLIRTSPTILTANHNLQNNTVIVNQNPLIKHGGNYVQTHFIKTIQQPALASSNGFQFKQNALVASSQNASTNNAPPTLVSPVKFQAIPMKQTVIISPPKISTASAALSPQKNSPSLVPQNIIKVVQATTPPPLIQTISQPKDQNAINQQTSVITKPPILVNPTSITSPNNNNNNPNVNLSAPVLPIKTNVIVSPPLKNKKNPNVESLSPTETKKQCTKFEFQCIFCQATFINEPKLLMEHMREYHAEKIPQQNGIKPAADKIEEAKVAFEEPKQVFCEEPKQLLFADLPKFDIPNKLITNNEAYDSKMETDDSDSASSTLSDNEDMSDDGSDLDEDESEVRDLIMDLENPQENFEDSSEEELNENEEEENGSSSSSSSDSSESDGNDSDDETSQDRSNTPESPEFEEHVPENTSENNQVSKDDNEEYTDEEYDLDSE